MQCSSLHRQHPILPFRWHQSILIPIALSLSPGTPCSPCRDGCINHNRSNSGTTVKTQTSARSFIRLLGLLVRNDSLGLHSPRRNSLSATNSTTLFSPSLYFTLLRPTPRHLLLSFRQRSGNPTSALVVYPYPARFRAPYSTPVHSPEMLRCSRFDLAQFLRCHSRDFGAYLWLPPTFARSYIGGAKSDLIPWIAMASIRYNE